MNILYVCHGKLDAWTFESYDFKKLKYHKPTDNIYTLDMYAKVQPDIKMNIKNVQEIPHKYISYFDKIILVYCPFDVFLNYDNYSIDVYTFISCYRFLKFNGLLYINNFRKYKTKTTRYWKKSKKINISTFLKPIEELFEFYDLEETQDHGNETLILRKI